MSKLYEFIEKIAYVVLSFLFKLIKKDLTDCQFENFMQFVRFGIVGVSNTIISYLIYVLSLLMLNKAFEKWNYNYFAAQTISFILSVLWSYYWNNKKVFKKEDGSRSTIITILKTYVTYAFTGLFLSNILLYVWIDIVGISELIAPILNLIISVPVNFLINKFWTFK